MPNHNITSEYGQCWNCDAFLIIYPEEHVAENKCPKCGSDVLRRYDNEDTMFHFKQALSYRTKCRLCKKTIEPREAHLSLQIWPMDEFLAHVDCWRDFLRWTVE